MPAYLSHSVFFHTLTNAHTLWHQKQLEQWKAIPDKPFRQILRGWLESFNSNKAWEKGLFALGNPPLARQGFARFICCAKLVHVSLFVLELIVAGWEGESDRTGSYSSPHAYLLILIHGRIGFFRSHFSSYARHGIFIAHALLMQLYRVNIAGSQYMFKDRGL